MIYESLCRFYRQQPEWKPSISLSSETKPTISVGASVIEVEPFLYEVVKQCYDIEKDDSTLREMLNMPEGERSSYFQRVRDDYPLRREFSNSKVMVTSAQRSFSEVLIAMGFRVGHQADPRI
jgi:erythronate-4-phosphate dehydrogenase